MNTCSCVCLSLIKNHEWLERTSELFKSFADPTRLAILCFLLGEEKPVGALAEALEHTPSAVSHQLRILRGLRLVKSRRSGQHIFYSLDDEHISALIEIAMTHVKEENALTLSQKRDKNDDDSVDISDRKKQGRKNFIRKSLGRKSLGRKGTSR